MLWSWLKWWIFKPHYRIIVGTSHASAADAAANAELHVNASIGAPIGIAASSMCCMKGDEAGGGTVEWDVYVLMRE